VQPAQQHRAPFQQIGFHRSPPPVATGRGPFRRTLTIAARGPPCPLSISGISFDKFRKSPWWPRRGRALKTPSPRDRSRGGMISLENVRIFLKAVETNSFSAAGRMLRLSPSVVSYRIQMLEDALGARLLTRTTRTMRLTEAGELFVDHCREIIEAVERAEASMAETSGVSAHGVLRITAPLGLGRRVIAPMMARYRQLQPHTD